MINKFFDYWLHLVLSAAALQLAQNERRFTLATARELQRLLELILREEKVANANTQNGILGVVLPPVAYNVFGISYICLNCGYAHNYVPVKGTAIGKFSYNDNICS